MRRNFASLSIACALLILCASAAHGQVVPATAIPRIDLSFGTGVTSWDPNWGNGRMLGITVWSDIHPTLLPSPFDGLGFEIEARDVDWHRDNQPSNFREATVGGGPIYTWPRFRIVQPYAKFLVDFAGINFNPGSTYNHDTRTAYVPGAGLEAHAWQNLWVRADYEFQIWQPLFNNQRLTPQGFTIGLDWDTRPLGSR
jgi:hypothetical protein